MTAVFGLLVLLLIVIGGIALVRRLTAGRADRESGQADLIPYGLLVLAVIAGGFALAQLGRAAFPGDSFVFDARQQVATSLATLVVAVPLAVYLWQRQARRRLARPASPGWTLYLTVINAVFITSLVVSAFQVLDWLLGEAPAPTWTDVIVFGGIVVAHELAARVTPPRSDAADLPRVVGSAAGLVPLVIGLGGLLYWVLERLYSTFAASAGGPSLATSLALVLVGAPVWVYYWLRPWPGEPGVPRKAWAFFASVIGLTSAIGSVVAMIISLLLFMLTASDPAGTHFDDLPIELTALTMGTLVWWHHRGRLGTERTDTLRAYQYAMAALGLASAIGFATALSAAALGDEVLVGASIDDIITMAVALVSSAAVWWWFWSKAARGPREIEAVAWPRRAYLLGMGIITGLVAAGALIGTLFVLFQRLLGASGTGDSLVVQASLFVFAGAAAWHLLQTYFQDRALVDKEEVITPYEVTIICSHPGMIATMLPKEARVKVVYRGDEAGQIDEERAAAIVDAVAHRSSLVWVDEEGFRVAPARG
jgi:hypothetical protein